MNDSYASLVIQKVCEKVEKSERAVEKLQEEITQLKKAIKKPKKHSEENESKIFIWVPPWPITQYKLRLVCRFQTKRLQSCSVRLHTNSFLVAVVTLVLYLIDKFDSYSH